MAIIIGALIMLGSNSLNNGAIKLRTIISKMTSGNNHRVTSTSNRSHRRFSNNIIILCRQEPYHSNSSSQFILCRQEPCHSNSNSSSSSQFILCKQEPSEITMEQLCHSNNNNQFILCKREPSEIIMELRHK